MFQAVLSYLKGEYVDGGTTLEDAKLLAVKALSQNLVISAESIKIATLKRNDESKKTEFEIVKLEDVKKLLQRVK